MHRPLPDELQPFGEDFGPLLTGPFAPVLDELDLTTCRC
jgi:hypothetical protein